VTPHQAKVGALVVLACIAGSLLIVLLAIATARPARAAAMGYHIEVDGERMLVLNVEAQQRLGAVLFAKDAEIAALRARLADQRKAECNLI
jgi:hypothetical protein